VDAAQAVERGFHAPETAATKCCCIQLFCLVFHISHFPNVAVFRVTNAHKLHQTPILAASKQEHTMPTEILPRGIRRIEWKNKTGEKAKQTRYRVQIRRKGEDRIDRFFDDLKEAKEFLALSKSVNGRQKLHEIETENERTSRFLNEWLNSPNIGYYLERFVKREFSYTPDTELKRRNLTNKKSLIRTIENTKIRVSPTRTGRVGEIILDDEVKELGKLKVDELDDFVIDSFIRSHLKEGKKKSSISSYLTMLNRFLSKLRFIDPIAYNKLKIKTVNNYDKDLLKNATTKNVVLIKDEDWQKILAAIFATSNIQFGLIILLSLSTGLRKSEVINLEWDNIKSNYFDLIFTKSGKPRRVYITQQARDILDMIDKREGDPRLFTYSIAGFSKMYRDLQIKHKFKHISFHQFRKNFISRVVQKYSHESSLFLTEVLGISNVAKFERDHLEPERVKEIDGQRELLKQIGHGNPQVSKDHYLKLIIQGD
jgi:integrase